MIVVDVGIVDRLLLSGLCDQVRDSQVPDGDVFNEIVHRAGGFDHLDGILPLEDSVRPPAHDVDVVFLQEVCQPKDNTLQCALTKEGNYALALQQLLRELGSTYQLYYDPIKIGFAIYEEGLGILSKHPLVHNTTKYISKTREYENWKARKILAYDLIQDNPK